MPENFEERTEQATPRRREEAREKGQVAKSSDLCAALTLLGALVILQLGGGTLLSTLARMTVKSLESLSGTALTAASVRTYYGWCTYFLLAASAPLLLGTVVVGVAGNLLQSGFIWTSEPLRPDLTRLDPVKGLGRLVSKRGFMRLMVSLFKVSVIGVIAYVTIKRDLPGAAAVLGLSPGEIVHYGAGLVLTLGYRVVAALVVLALVDYAFQRFQYERDLMMTKQELREEMKRMEGDPLTRERRRRMQRQIAMQRMMSKVPKADVVITNPTHLAIAIQYDAETMAAPVCVAKGAGFIAERIRELATGAGVPIVENKPVARMLYRKVEIGAPIPVELYQAVAEILAYVYRIEGRTLEGAAA